MNSSTRNNEIGAALLYCPTAHGGLAEHSHYQALALQRLGQRFVVLCPERYVALRNVTYLCESRLVTFPRPTWAVLRNLTSICELIVRQLQLFRHVVAKRPRFVLLQAYSEDFAPLWWFLQVFCARSLGITYGANLHDPVRQRFFGPEWFHRWSVRCAYAPLSFVVVHGSVDAASARIPSHVMQIEAPLGLYCVSPAATSARRVTRARYGIPKDNVVFLAFGHVTDRKNLNLAIRALASVPRATLLIVGQVVSSRDRPIAYYRSLATEMGVSGRVHIDDRFIPDSEIADFFEACDVVLLAYRRDFVSKSGVLNVAANWDKPILASSGAGSIAEIATQYELGAVVKPDSVEAMIEGMHRLCSGPPYRPNWNGYRAVNSWDRNVQLLLDVVANPKVLAGEN
jgi:glycosyltransferase involved in cell wall biosynthesis